MSNKTDIEVAVNELCRYLKVCRFHFNEHKSVGSYIKTLTDRITDVIDDETARKELAEGLANDFSFTTETVPRSIPRQIDGIYVKCCKIGHIRRSRAKHGEMLPAWAVRREESRASVSKEYLHLKRFVDALRNRLLGYE